MGPLVIACAVMIDELRRLLPAGVPTRVLEMSLHTHPDRLHAALRTEIDQADGRHDPIILGYGLCGMAAVGKARLSQPVGREVSRKKVRR